MASVSLSRQIYLGPGRRGYRAMGKREPGGAGLA